MWYDGTESQPSPVQTMPNDLERKGAYNALDITPLSTIVQYFNFYKWQGGVYAWIGQSANGTFIDDNIIGDPLKTPPYDDSVSFGNATGNYPMAVTYYEQRRWFGGTDNNPQGLYATNLGVDGVMYVTQPVQADSAILIRLAARQQDRIQHLVPLNDIIAFTAGGEWKITSADTGGITPMSIEAKPQGYAGSSMVQPVVTANSVIFVQAQGARIRELAYSNDARSYVTNDLTIFAPHLFDGHTILDMAYVRAPYPTLWVLRDDGVLLSLTHMPEQEVYGWAQHETAGTVESICVVAEDNQDVLYLVVRRMMGTNERCCVERMSPPTGVFGVAWIEDYYLDCGVIVWQGGASFQTVTGLNWLVGAEVQILTNEGLHRPMTVPAGGAITLDWATPLASIGLPYTSTAVTLPLAIEAEAAGQGMKKNVTRTYLRTQNSTDINAGPALDKLRAYPIRQVADGFNTAPGKLTGEINLTMNPMWGNDGRLCIVQDEPLPLEVLSMTLEVSTGD